jgi:hypothetical protein
VGGKKFQQKISFLKTGHRNGVLSPYNPPVISNNNRIRKLVYFPDREGKCRVVAILDYFSQSVLKPLHSYLFRILKRIKQDCTFAQGSFKDDPEFMKCDGSTYVSADLSAATDRFPIKVISSVLKGRLPHEYVSA